MRILIYLIPIILIGCGNSHTEEKKSIKIITNTAYQNKLNETKKNYPFERWHEGYAGGLTQYTEENCNKAKKIFDDLISDLISAGENANEETKVQIFKTAILATNELNNENNAIIETGEREDLCELTDVITIACGLDPKKYGAGEGLASEWREW